MNRNQKAIVASLAAVCLLTCGSAFGQDKTQVKGIIENRTGETLIVTGSDAKTTVVLTETTRVKDDKGLFGWGKEELSATVLIPGLKVKVDGTTDDQGRLVAKTITTDGDDMETAEMIQAGLHPTAEQVAANVQKLEEHHGRINANQQDIAANKQDISANKGDIAANKQQISENLQDIQEHTDRFNALTDFDVKGQSTVKFKSGSTKIAPEDVEQLKQLAATATGLKGYLIEVTGFADSQGDAAANTVLSEKRAKEVINVLVQQGSIPIRHIVAPGAMGEYGNAAPNETKEGRAENRRVEVKVLVNKGLAGN